MREPKPRQSARELAARVVEVLREEGTVGFFDRALPRIGLRRLLFLERRTEPASTAGADPATPLALVEAGEADLDALAALRATDQDEASRTGGSHPSLAQRYRKLTAHGDRCFVIRSEGRVVAAVWVARGAVPVAYVMCDLLLTPDEAYLYDTFVVPELRGRGLASKLYQGVAAQLAASGVSRAVMFVRAHNAPSLQSALKAGFRRTATLGCLRVGARFFHRGRPSVALRHWPATPPNVGR